MPITLSCHAFSIAGELNSVIAGLTRAGNETGDLNLLLLQAHVSASTEKVVLHQMLAKIYAALSCLHFIPC